MERKLKKKNLIIISIITILLFGGVTFAITKFWGNDNNDTKKNDINNKKPNNDNKDNEEVIPEVQIIDVDSKSRPYAVMINNANAARPYHTGLQDAYIVYEIIVEGGITRYLALFKDVNTSMIGSVRSARHYYLDYALENDALYIHHGYSPQAQSDFKKLNIDRIEINTTTTGWREKLNVATEHTLFTSIQKLDKGLGNKRTETNKDLLFNYSALNIDTSKLNGVVNANNVYNTTSYEYDSDANVYKQSVNNKEHVDYKTKEQYTVKNIITYQVKNSTISGGGKGRQEIDNIGSGKGYYITNGVAIPITWEKKSRSAQTIYKYNDGTEITVNDGNTWIHIVPTSGKVSIS